MQWNEVVDSSHTNNTMGYQQRLQRSGIREQTADLPTMQCDSNNEVNAVEEGSGPLTYEQCNTIRTTSQCNGTE